MYTNIKHHHQNLSKRYTLSKYKESYGTTYDLLYYFGESNTKLNSSIAFQLRLLLCDVSSHYFSPTTGHWT